MDLEHVNRLLSALPAYVEVELEIEHFPTQRLLTRDLPGEDRRLTSLTSGAEWFLPLGVIGIRNVKVAALNIQVIE